MRLAWAQARAPMLWVAGGVVLVTAFLGLTGPHLASLYTNTISPCSVHGDCSTARKAFLQNDTSLRGLLGYLVVLVPAMLGVFWGAPLVSRELEAGTHRLAWTQSVTRTRWLAVKLALAATAAVVMTGLLSLMVTWWELPFDRVLHDQYRFFDQRGIVPIASALFAVVLGTTVGLVVRRLSVAMAVTLATFAAARLADVYWLRPRLFPAHTTTPLNFGGNVGLEMDHSGASIHLVSTPSLPNAMVTASSIVHKGTGAAATSTDLSRFLHTSCRALEAAQKRPNTAAAQSAFQHCLSQISTQYQVAIEYQPASRYWLLQGTDVALLLVASIALTWFCFWWIRHRVA